MHVPLYMCVHMCMYMCLYTCVYARGQLRKQIIFLYLKNEFIIILCMCT